MIDISNIEGAIFDVDGTMLDSMWMWDIIEADFLEKYCVNIESGLIDQLRTLSHYDLSKHLQTEYGINISPQEIIREKSILLEEFYSQKAELKPGVIALLETLRSKNVKMCVATATDKYLVESGMQRLGIMEYFAKVFSCVQEETNKTEPDIYISAAEFLGTEIGATLVFEDALYAIQTAKKAGFPVVAVHDQTADAHQDEIRRHADHYFVTLDEMKIK
ncbi:MAG: HAD family phosphatase [Oscillospiraceae bacterium]|nr:HAD family phosphatase [Oscillospiraceae bacterium]